jgi:hypothetical protein
MVRTTTKAIVGLGLLVLLGAGPAAAGTKPTRVSEDTPRASKTIRGKPGYGLRLAKPKPLPDEVLEKIGEELESEEGRVDPPRLRGPFKRRTPPTTVSSFRYPFRPGRRSDDAAPPLPDFPAAGAGGVTTTGRGTARSTVQVGPAPDDFAFFRNQPIAQWTDGNGLLNMVAEPTWANDGDVILSASNTIADFSEDGGITWAPLSVVDAAAGRDNVDGGFAGDQVVYAVNNGLGIRFPNGTVDVPRLIFWTMMYFNDGTDNTIRLQVYHGGDEVVSQTGQCTYDFKASQMGMPADTWIDAPRVAATDKYLYMMGKVYDPNGTEDSGDDSYLESRVWRIEIDELENTNCNDPLSWQYYPNAAGASDGAPTPVQGADDVMYWAYLEYDSPTQTQQLKVWRHDDADAAATLKTYDLSDYPVAAPGVARCTTPGPTVGNPCGYEQSSLSAENGWIGADDFGWMWNAAQGPGIDWPYIQAARFRLGGKRRLKDEPQVGGDAAWNYGGVGVNASGHLGIVAYEMGNGINPSPRAGLIDDVDPTWSPTFHSIIEGQDTIGLDRWGDYTTVRAYDGCTNLFGATSFSQQDYLGDLGLGFQNTEVRFTIFGRARDACGDLQPLRTLWRPDPRREDDLHPLSANSSFFSRTNIRNTGPGRTPTSNLDFVLSRDETLSKEDVRLDSDVRQVPALDAGETAGVVARSTVPSGARGSYHLLTCAQASKLVRQITAANDCVAADDAVYVQGGAKDIGIRSFTLPQRKGVVQVDDHAVGARGRVPVAVDLVANEAPDDRVVQFHLASGASVARGSKPLAELTAADLGPARAAATRRLRVRATLRLPRAAKRGRRYRLIACTVRRRGARPEARNCLPARQRILVKR